MSDNQLMVAATTYPVAVAFSASIGDHVLVINNVCIGLAPRRLESSKPPGVPWPYQTDPRRGKDEERRILDILADGPTTSEKICERLGLSLKDPARARERARLIRMRDRGQVAVFPEDKGKWRPRYQLPRGNKKP